MTDPCLYGVWQAESNAFGEWLRANGIPFDVTLESPFIGEFHPAHHFMSPPYNYQSAYSVAGIAGSGRGQTSQAYGCWSVKEAGLVSFCYADDTPRISATVYVAGRVHQKQTPPRSRPIQTHAYDCGADELVLYISRSQEA